jgi:hypothetical protein
MKEGKRKDLLSFFILHPKKTPAADVEISTTISNFNNNSLHKPTREKRPG